MTVKERITALRARMKETGIDAYLIPTDDFHGMQVNISNAENISQDLPVLQALR